MSQNFDGRPVLLTGGTGGLGVAVVRAFLDAGAQVIVPFPEGLLGGPLTEVKSDRLSTVAGVDLTDEAAVVRLYADLPALWASVHLTGGFAMKPVTEIGLDDLRGQLRVNLETAFLCCREAVRTMRARPAPGARGGRIVNVAARAGVVPTAGMLAYATAKAGVAALTQHLAAEVTPEGILVNAVLPSIIDTPANRRAMPKADFETWPKAEELAAVIRFLASPQSAITSGSLVPVYGRA